MELQSAHSTSSCHSTSPALLKHEKQTRKWLWTTDIRSGQGQRGVEKGNEEAQRLVSNAREEAAKILEEARKEAEAIMANARKAAAETAENTQSEIKLFAGQAVNALKTEVASLLTNQVGKTQIIFLNVFFLFLSLFELFGI